MGKHEIRLRRQRLTARGTERFRNYGAVLKQHEEERKMKIIVKIFTFFLIIVALIIIFITISRWENKQPNKTSKQNSLIEFRLNKT